ncbi:hypothetical protein N7510_002131 [Penicillium lagena]|uniref:uncharacterized protein n=1 Tax=Penicillium lagena TaxID=94218 RepID=UPI00254221A0|nr:uncharacterized protein N7510_002131 [Penicillium lagena]KAJ5625822.1 hypothetical protein N7510_002131 [Penicillium lagena]
MVAGVVGIEAHSGANAQVCDEKPTKDSIQPFSAWWMFEELDEAEVAKKKEKEITEQEAYWKDLKRK